MLGKKHIWNHHLVFLGDWHCPLDSPWNLPMGPQRPSEGRNVPNSSGVAARRSAGLVPNRWKCPARGKCLLYNDGLKKVFLLDLWSLGFSWCIHMWNWKVYGIYIYTPKYPHFPGSLSIWKQGSIVTCISGRNLVPNLKGTGRWGFAVCPPYLKDPVLRICGSFRGETKPFRTRLTLLRGRKLTMVINHLLNGMILKVNTTSIP